MGNEFDRQERFNSAQKGAGAESATTGATAEYKRTPPLADDHEMNDELGLTNTTAINPKERRPRSTDVVYIDMGQTLNINPKARRTSSLG